MSGCEKTAAAQGIGNRSNNARRPSYAADPTQLHNRSITDLDKAIYTGWNPRHPDQGVPEQLVRIHGSTLPFARSKREREQRSDQRLSIEERYASKDAYLEQVSKAAEALIAACYLLPEDLDGIVQRAVQRYDLYTRQCDSHDSPAI
jgi:hypothetical protein